MIRKQMLEERYKDQTLQKYYNIVGSNSSKARSLIKRLNYKQDPYLLRCIALTYFDESRLDDNNNPREVFDARKLRLAERYIINAYILNENCIDVLYTLGEIRNAYRQTDLAIYCYKRIVEVGSRAIPRKDKCTDRSLVQIKVNDSRFQLYRLYHDKGEYAMSKRYLSTYKKGLEKGIGTLYKPLEKYLMD
jgi:hypothetical protein